MVKLNQGNIDPTICKQDLIAFGKLLEPGTELGETLLLKFFREHPNLILLMGKLGIGKPELYKEEFNIFNEFRSDFTVCNIQRDKYVFIEFEEAKKGSIFREVGDNKGIARYEWSPDFEHGFSQVVDWFFRLDDFAKTNKFIEHFGVKDITYSGYLVIGRQKASIPNFGYQAKLDWRSKNIVVNGKTIICMTYDQLYIELQKKIDESEVELINFD